MVAAYSQQAARRLAEFTPQGLANTAWALAKLGAGHSHLPDDRAAAASGGRKRPASNATAAGAAAGGAAAPGVGGAAVGEVGGAVGLERAPAGRELFRRIADAALPQLADFSAQGLSNLGERPQRHLLLVSHRLCDCFGASGARRCRSCGVCFGARAVELR